jgi:hypothetical protein
MKEKVIEEYLRDEIKAIGGRAYKFISPGNDGVPDRLAVLPGGRVIFVELKATGKGPRPLQELQIKRLQDLGHTVFVIDSKQGVDAVVQFCKGMTA